MPVPILFSRTQRLTVAAPTVTLSGIPQTATDLMVSVRARLDASLDNNIWLALRINGDASSVYRANASYATTTTYSTGITGDGFDTAQFIIAEVNEAQAGTAGAFTTFFGMLPRYSTAEVHALNGMGILIFDDGNIDSEYRRVTAGGYHNSAVAVSSLELLNETGLDFAADTSITVWGLADEGDAFLSARSAGTLAIDFDGDEFKDVAVVAGANVFTASNPRIGRTISVRISGGDGTTTLTMPTGTQIVENSYVPGQDAWIFIRCTNELGPEFVASIKDIA